MATTYFLTTTPSDLSGGNNFSNELSTTAPGTTTLSVSVTTNTTETDRGFTATDDPGASGGTGARDYSVVVDINTGNADLQVSIQLHRINSGGTVQASSAASGEQTANAGQQTHTFTGADLGTFVAGDRFRVDFILRDTTLHGDEALIYDIGDAMTAVTAPWTLSAPAAPTLAYAIQLVRPRRIARGQKKYQ